MLLAQSPINAIKSLEEKNFFKLVCGASLNDLLLVENLSFLFTLAGADVIDLAARADVIYAARKGVNRALSIHCSSLIPLLMASIQLDKDPHFRKVKVNYDKCDLCGVCVNVCPTEAFAIGTRNKPPNRVGRASSYVPSPEFVYKSERCFGCDACPKACHVSALSMAEMEFNPSVIITEMIDLEVDAIEFHFGKNYE
ncbi:MAG: 4Fe-4S dicluster domain-containing protein, partial [Candidatus Melainabacteria bacterium]|nr:4Fe-4S dicluster domain-containing protein [Candidatus Melainabacteria bacterium]